MTGATLSRLGVAISILWMMPGSVRAQEQAGQLGLGVIIGTPLGFSVKYLIDSKKAVDVAFGAQDSDLDAHVDYLVHRRDIPQKKWKGALYSGLGIKFKGERDTLFGLRFVGGACVVVPQSPVEFFMELAPVLRLTPYVRGDLDGGVGLRHYF